MRKALVVGINYYEYCPSLYGCVDDAHAVKSILERHGDGSTNFNVTLLTGVEPTNAVSRAVLKDCVKELFEGDNDIALFYFAGYGHIEIEGGYLLATDSRRGDEGIPLTEILTFANKSKAKNKILLLDSCHSGIAGWSPTSGDNSVLSEGLTILTASTKDQYAEEQNGKGVFTTLLVDALSGGAANILGEISPGSVYAYIDKSLGSWNEQRPVFKTNVKSFVSLRKVQPSIELADLQRIVEFFPMPGFEYPLDPSFEPELKGRSDGMPAPNPENTRKFAILQKYNRLNLLVPEKAPHMWHAAMESKSCKLTVLGEHYWQLVSKKRL